MIDTHLKEGKDGIQVDDGVREIKLFCKVCPRQCEMTLLMEGLSVLMVKDDGCKKGSKFAYREMKNRKMQKYQNGTCCCEMDPIEEAV
ncbi:hypothetical protein [Acetobacterium sp. KB-1]|jgi:hypothetical protein|uniref:hypothetical protein n=1 Tax=Acetobacterium TaxID=33951 RepID=UPI000DBEB90F|nr:hypothetical protein [Acetobacterium sp. KB-1]AWW27216.1 hypothetical protein DOZ58_11575 [Acetobacterium sp. KB-1]